ncbi:MAG: hypothetical protein U0795_24890 [Pirellulales bacterium]
MDLIRRAGPAEEYYYERFAKNPRELPVFLTKHSDGIPSNICVIREGSPGRDHVVVTWGGGFGHWGLKIGGETYRPEADGSEFYNVEWCAGIYVWHELQ